MAINQSLVFQEPSHLSFSCRECSEAIHFALTDLCNGSHLLCCRACGQRHLFDDPQLVQQLLQLEALCWQIYQSRQLLPRTSVLLERQDWRVQFPLRLLLTRLTGCLQLQSGDAFSSIHFRLHPSTMYEGKSFEPRKGSGRELFGSLSGHCIGCDAPFSFFFEQLSTAKGLLHCPECQWQKLLEQQLPQLAQFLALSLQLKEVDELLSEEQVGVDRLDGRQLLVSYRLLLTEYPKQLNLTLDDGTLFPIALQPAR